MKGDLKMENVCKDCGIFLLTHQEVCPCCGWVKESLYHDAIPPQFPPLSNNLDPLAESLSDDVVQDHFSGY